MKKIISKPYLFFFALIPIFIILGSIQSDKAIDINLHDTYFVIDINYWFYLSAIFFGLLGLNYFCLYWIKKPPKKWLTITHLFLQIVASLLFITSDSWNWLFTKNNSMNYSDLSYSNSIIAFSIIIFLFSIFIHLINFFVSLLLKKE